MGFSVPHNENDVTRYSIYVEISTNSTDLVGHAGVRVRGSRDARDAMRTPSNNTTHGFWPWRFFGGRIRREPMLFVDHLFLYHHDEKLPNVGKKK